MFLVPGSFGTGSTGYVVELFPTEMRGSAMASLALVGQVAGYSAPVVMGVIVDRVDSLAVSFIIPAAAILVVGAPFLFVNPETINVDTDEVCARDQMAARSQ